VTERPSGHPPPAETRLPGGRTLDLADPARDVCARYAAEVPDEEARYGEAWMPWCRHDNQHILNWAAQDLAGFSVLHRQLDWLYDVLAARDFPVERLSRDVELCADVMAERDEPELAERLRVAAARLGDRG
jgi:hypothetical protein